MRTISEEELMDGDEIPRWDTFANAEAMKISPLPEPSEWTCELFGCGDAIVLKPVKDKVPNWFWRKMQYLLLGNKWIKA